MNFFKGTGWENDGVAPHIPFTWNPAKNQYECDWTGVNGIFEMYYVSPELAGSGDVVAFSFFVEEAASAGDPQDINVVVNNDGLAGASSLLWNTANAPPAPSSAISFNINGFQYPGFRLDKTGGGVTKFTRLKMSVSPGVASAQGAVSSGLNCECVTPYNTDTLENLRRRMMVRLGYAASANNPPPGMVELLNDFLMESQRFLYEKVAGFRDSRYFTWDLIQGTRLYGYGASDEPCGLPFQPEQVEAVWVVDGDPSSERWNPLICGIDASLYSNGFYESWPQRYDMRQCIELWPAPDVRTGKLVVKAKSGLGPFAADGDRTSIDSDLVFLLALANAKTHYNKPDAQTYGGMVQSRIADIVAAQHLTKRYVPGDGPGWVPPQPIMVGGWQP